MRSFITFAALTTVSAAGSKLNFQNDGSGVNYLVDYNGGASNTMVMGNSETCTRIDGSGDCIGDVLAGLRADIDLFTGFAAEARNNITSLQNSLTAISTPVKYTLGGDAAFNEDRVFEACPAGSKPAEMKTLSDRLDIEDFIKQQNSPRGTMYLGNWFPGSAYGSHSGPHGTCPNANHIGYLSGYTRTWTETADAVFQAAMSSTWNGNGNCVTDTTHDANGQNYDTIPLVVGPNNNVDIG